MWGEGVRCEFTHKLSWSIVTQKNKLVRQICTTSNHLSGGKWVHITKEVQKVLNDKINDRNISRI